MSAPSGRTIFLIVPELLSVLSFQVYCNPECCPAGNSHQQIPRINARQRIRKSRCKNTIKDQTLNLFRCIYSGCNSPCLTKICCKQSQNDIGDIQDQLLFQLFCIHRDLSFFFSATFFGIAATISLNFLSFSRTLVFSTEGFLTCFAE